MEAEPVKRWAIWNCNIIDIKWGKEKKKKKPHKKQTTRKSEVLVSPWKCFKRSLKVILKAICTDYTVKKFSKWNKEHHAVKQWKTKNTSRIKERFHKQESAAETKLETASSHDELQTISRGFDGDAVLRTLGFYSIPASPKGLYSVVTGLLKHLWQCIFTVEQKIPCRNGLTGETRHPYACVRAYEAYALKMSFTATRNA